MDIEQRQSELIDQFVKQASAASNAPAISSVIVDATSHPLLFAFSEILALPNVHQVPSFSDFCCDFWIVLFIYASVS